MDPFQKLCHSETRKLVLVIGIITSTVIAIQFFLPPYENVLAHLFPKDNAFLHAKNSSLAGDFSPNSVMNYNGPHSNPSSTNFSLVDGVVNKTSSEAFQLGEETKNQTTGDDGQKNGSVSVLLILPPVVSPTNLSILRKLHSGPAMPPMAEEPGLLLSVPAMPPNAEKPGLLKSGPAMPPNAAKPGLLQSSSIMPPIADNAGLLQGVSVMTPPKAENPGLLQIAPAKPPNTETPQLLQSGLDASNNKSSMSTTNIQKARVKVPPKVITSISEMNVLLRQSHASSGSTRPLWSSLPDQEILSAKSQIENAPMIKNDRELYAPLFRNASMFKKSYELMEEKLKVFIYSEGARPIFHQPILGGIYASEGWFMKQMESNKHFVVKDPKKAHLFYFPFSSQVLRYTLYIPDSHSRKNIVKYLKNYMSIITTRYPFWNRTGGADHFLVACHDWAPSETEKAMGGSIRALCNADVNEAGGFIMGKDVSLPEANVRSVSNPLKDLGGKPASKRTILAFFAGRAHGHLRQILLKHWENKDPNMKIYNGTNTRVVSKNYIQYMKNSKYCICPKGYEVNSPRIVEAIFFECVPVIISDNFVPPFFNVLDWETFAIFIPEKDIPKLKIILDSIPEQKYLELQKRVKKAQQHFLWHTKPVKYDMFHMILHSIWYNRVFQI